ncbi:MAG: hypothetical protein HY964_08065 [Ignavibacteriales bacterium]|nr:hypothetical protein [Ignavibacteriales bacterium]
MLLNRRNISLVIRSLIVVMAIVVLKLFLHQYSIEFITINNLFSGIVAANVFLIGFLLSGILSDYKESEKIPGEIAVHISILYDEAVILSANDNELSDMIKTRIKIALSSILDWFYRKIKTNDILDKLEEINLLLSKYDGKVQANYIIRLKQEISNLKRLVIRTDTIRDTNFISSGYLIATFTTFILCFGLIFSKLDPFVESVFFVGAISFLMVFLLYLIHDLDNPFNYNTKTSVENISLHPINRILNRIENK